MITFSTVTSIDDTEFDDLFAASLPDLDAGSYPWHLFPQIVTVEDKRSHMRAAYDRLLEDGIVWRVADSDGVLLLNAGEQTGDTLRWVLGLVKPDASGSKSYFYSEEYRNARDAYWSQIGISGWTLETAGANTPVHTHFLSRQSANAIGTGLTETVKELNPDIVLMDLKLG